VTSPIMLRRSRRDIRVTVSPSGVGAAAGKPGACQRYSLSAITIPKLSISDDGDSSDGATTGW